MTLVTLEEAKENCGVTHDGQDSLIDAMCHRATGIIIDYCEAFAKIQGSPQDWDQETVPVPVKAAILELVANMHRNRGDVGDAPGPITPRIVNLLRRIRMPALA